MLSEDQRLVIVLLPILAFPSDITLLRKKCKNRRQEKASLHLVI